MSVVSATRSVVLCYGSPRKLYTDTQSLPTASCPLSEGPSSQITNICVAAVPVRNGVRLGVCILTHAFGVSYVRYSLKTASSLL